MDSVPTGPGAGPSAARSLERGMCRRQAGTGMSVSPPGKGARPRDVAGAWPVLRRGPATRPGADRAGPAGAGDRLALTVGAGAMTGIVFRGALAWATPLPLGVLCPVARTRASRASRRWAPSAAPSGKRTARSASCRGIRLPPGPAPRGADLVPEAGPGREREGNPGGARMFALLTSGSREPGPAGMSGARRRSVFPPAPRADIRHGRTDGKASSRTHACAIW